ncbi:hypothetical protein [Lacrimispora sp.]|uniref:hypothetical protein n=1 Tax=Lacrimispora sp. TaxID=2719234 RepID=UPI0032E37D4F
MNRKNRSNVMMMEMIVAVFFFLLCAAVCIQAFVKADLLSKRAADLNQSVLIAQSVAEIWKAEGEAGLIHRFNGVKQDSPVETYIMMFDKKGNAADQSQAVYYGEVKPVSELEAEVTVSKAGNTLYTLAVGRHENP